MGTPERRRRRQELRAEADAYTAEAKAIFERVERRLEERRERANQNFFRRLFSGRRVS